MASSFSFFCFLTRVLCVVLSLGSGCDTSTELTSRVCVQPPPSPSPSPSSHAPTSLCCPQVDKLDEADSQRKTEEEVTEPQPIVFGQQLMLPPSPAPVAPQPAYPGYGYPAAPAGFPAQPAYGFNM